MERKEKKQKNLHWQETESAECFFFLVWHVTKFLSNVYFWDHTFNGVQRKLENHKEIQKNPELFWQWRRCKSWKLTSTVGEMKICQPTTWFKTINWSKRPNSFKKSEQNTAEPFLVSTWLPLKTQNALSNAFGVTKTPCVAHEFGY